MPLALPGSSSRDASSAEPGAANPPALQASSSSPRSGQTTPPLDLAPPLAFLEETSLSSWAEAATAELEVEPLPLTSLAADFAGSRFPWCMPALRWPNVVGSQDMLRQILLARTSFSYFVRRWLHCCKGARLAPNDALFPLPLPVGDCWSAGLENLGVERRARVAVRRCLFLVVAGLNFMHYVEPLSVLQDIRRLPSPCHVSVYCRLMALMRACGPDEVLTILSCGRKSFQIDARLRGLLSSLQRLGLSNVSRYDQSAGGAEVEVLADREELRPYRPLDPSRLKLTGEGAWDCRPFLSDLFWVNQFSVVPPDEVLRDLMSVKKDDVIQLALLWDAKGILRLFPRQLGPQHQWVIARCSTITRGLQAIGRLVIVVD